MSYYTGRDYTKLTKEELFEIILNKEDYISEVLESAMREINQRQLNHEIGEIIQNRLKKAHEEQEELEYWNQAEEEDLRDCISLPSDSEEERLFKTVLQSRNIPFQSETVDHEDMPFTYYFFHENDLPTAEAIVNKIFEKVGDPPKKTFLDRYHETLTLFVKIFVGFLVLLLIYIMLFS